MNKQEFRKMVDNDQTIMNIVANYDSMLRTVSTLCQRVMDIEKRLDKLEGGN